VTFPAGPGAGINAAGPFFGNAAATTIDLTLDNVGKGPLPPTGRTVTSTQELLNNTNEVVTQQGFPAIANVASINISGVPQGSIAVFRFD
jgi:hypothetical protein